jgi:hypothetical protein
VPGSFSGRAISGSAGPYSTTPLIAPETGGSLDYTVRVPRSGRYVVTVGAGATSAGEQVRLSANGVALTTRTLGNNGSLTTTVDNAFTAVDLPEGLVVLRLTTIASPGQWAVGTIRVDPVPVAVPMPTTPSRASPAPGRAAAAPIWSRAASPA